MVREYVDVPNHASLDELIEALTTLRGQLPADWPAEIRLRGDDIFGRKLSISYLRPQTAAEKACDERYRNSYREQRRRQLAQLQAELREEALYGEDLDRAA
jgi:hypothetical protein